MESQNGTNDGADGIRGASAMLLEVLSQVADVLDDPVVSLECDTAVSGRQPDITSLAIRLVLIVEAIERDLESAAAGALVATVSQLRIEQACASFTERRPEDNDPDPSLATLRQSLHQARLRITQWLGSSSAPSSVHTAANGAKQVEIYLSGGLAPLVLAVDRLDRAVGAITPLSRQVLQLVVSEAVADACQRRGARAALDLVVDLATAPNLPSAAAWPRM